MPESEPWILLVEMDYHAGTTRIERSDGKFAELPLDLGEGRLPNVRKVSWAPRAPGLLVEMASGDYVVNEVPKFDQADQQDGRLVVYLDQNKWRSMADAHFNPSNVRDRDDLDAALRLAELVDQHKVILPLSSGHGAETTKWGDAAERYQLALRALQLSHGWQMRDPLAVRRNEMYEEFRTEFETDATRRDQPVFTLQPNANAQTRRRPSPGLLTESQHAFQSISFAMATIDAWLDAEQIPPVKDPGWVRTQQEFSDWLDSEVSRTGAQKRKSIDAMLINDLSNELAEEAAAARLTPEQLSTWVRRRHNAELNRMPSIGVYRGLLHERHVNVGTRWTGNDLTDMIYLSCAVGYADIVIAERHTTAMATQVLKRLGRPAMIFPNLRSAIPAIEEQLRS